MKKPLLYAAGAAAGLVCGTFGVGGGILAQPLLAAAGMDAAHSHASCVAMIFAVCLPPAFFAAAASPELLPAALPYLPGTLLGALCAALWMNRIPQPLLRIVFGASLAASAAAMALR